MGTPHKHAEILRAIADGKEVQWSKNGGHTWGDYRNDGSGYDPLTHLDILWRIKPEPKPDVVYYGSLGRIVGPFLDTCFSIHHDNTDKLKLTFDGETGVLKAAEVLK